MFVIEVVAVGLDFLETLTTESSNDRPGLSCHFRRTATDSQVVTLLNQRTHHSVFDVLRRDVLERRGEADSRGARGALCVRHDQRRWPLSGEAIV